MRRLLSHPAISFIGILLYRNLRHTGTSAERTVQMLPAPTLGTDAWHRRLAPMPGRKARRRCSSQLQSDPTWGDDVRTSQHSGESTSE